MTWTNKPLKQILILLNEAEISTSKENEKAILESALPLTSYISDSHQQKNYKEYIMNKLARLR